MIPKVIHYCWFGRNPKNDIIQKCINSWQKYCPDYEIIEWNEDNFDVNMIPYTRNAYAEEKYAYVSDFARLWIIYNHGGFYLDTDVLLHRNSLDELCKYDCWLACDDVKYIATGLGFGAIQSHPLIGKMCNAYMLSKSFTTNTVLDTPIVEDTLKDWTKSVHSQYINNVYIIGVKDYCNFASHLYTAMGQFKTPLEEEERLKKIRERLGRSSTWKERFAFKFRVRIRNPKIIEFCNKRKKSIISKTYFFLAYDLVEAGPMYYFKKLFNKLFK